MITEKMIIGVEIYGERNGTVEVTTWYGDEPYDWDRMITYDLPLDFDEAILNVGDTFECKLLDKYNVKITNTYHNNTFNHIEVIPDCDYYGGFKNLVISASGGKWIVVDKDVTTVNFENIAIEINRL